MGALLPRLQKPQLPLALGLLNSQKQRETWLELCSRPALCSELRTSTLTLEGMCQCHPDAPMLSGARHRLLVVCSPPTNPHSGPGLSVSSFFK